MLTARTVKTNSKITKPTLEAKDLVYRTRPRTILDGVALAVQQGELMVLLGPNGAGKSTLLRLLAGELQPSSGTVLLNGLDVHTIPPAIQAQQRAVLPQHSPLSFPFSVAEVVEMGRVPHPNAAQVVHQAARSFAVTHSDIADFMPRPYTELSGGERQRVHFARVLAQLYPPEAGKCLLLDEPIAALDPAHQHALLRTAKAIANDGVAVLAILHDLNLAAQYADRIALLAQGKIAATGSPYTVLTETNIADVFGIACKVTPHPFAPYPLVLPL